MITEPLILENTLNAPVAKVWKALTDKDEMKQWYFNIAAFKPEPGFEFSFDAGEDVIYTHLCKILEAVPEKKLSYTWQYKDYPGSSILTFQLFPEGESKTRLKLTHAGLETFPQDKPDFARVSFQQGWSYFMDKGFPEYIAKTT